MPMRRANSRASPEACNSTKYRYRSASVSFLRMPITCLPALALAPLDGMLRSGYLASMTSRE
jgi:hypothetical protein